MWIVTLCCVCCVSLCEGVRWRVLVLFHCVYVCFIMVRCGSLCVGLFRCVMLCFAVVRCVLLYDVVL